MGCTSSSPRENAAYAPIDINNPSPVSDRDQNRIYSGPGTPGSMAATQEDIQLSSRIRELLMEDKKLAPPPSSVSVIVNHGVVTLQGAVPSPKAKQHIDEQLAQVPGVARLDDQLQVRWY